MHYPPTILLKPLMLLFITCASGIHTTERVLEHKNTPTRNLPSTITVNELRRSLAYRETNVGSSEQALQRLLEQMCSTPSSPVQGLGITLLNLIKITDYEDLLCPALQRYAQNTIATYGDQHDDTCYRLVGAAQLVLATVQ